jgi:hypothetical protein
LSRDLKSLQSAQKVEVVEASPIVPAFVGPMKKKVKSGKKVVPWTKFEYQNKEGPSGITLRHVRPLDDPNRNTNVFLRFDKKIDVPQTPSDAEYELVKCGDWSRDETNELLQLASQFDARLVVVHDRWNHEKYPRSLDELKRRFYDLQSILSEGKEHRFVFDFEGAVKRKVVFF